MEPKTKKQKHKNGKRGHAREEKEKVKVFGSSRKFSLIQKKVKEKGESFMLMLNL